jgi:hypothetical protein
MIRAAARHNKHFHNTWQGGVCFCKRWRIAGEHILCDGVQTLQHAFQRVVLDNCCHSHIWLHFLGVQYSFQCDLLSFSVCFEPELCYARCNQLHAWTSKAAEWAFILPPVLAWVVNIVGIFYATTTSVLFLFPPRRPVDVEDMNYGSVVLVLVLLGCLTAWIVHGQEKYEGSAMLK